MLTSTILHQYSNTPCHCHIGLDTTDIADFVKCCSEVPRVECNKVERQECRQIPRQECEQVARQECRDVPSQVPRQECSQVGGDWPGRGHVTTVTGSDWWMMQVPRQECKQVPREVCEQVAKQVCNQVPRENCRDIPREVGRSNKWCQGILNLT